jgi:hypothetical protein
MPKPIVIGSAALAGPRASTPAAIATADRDKAERRGRRESRCETISLPPIVFGHPLGGSAHSPTLAASNKAPRRLHGLSAWFRCSSLELPVSDSASAAETIDIRRSGERNNSEEACCYSAVFRCFALLFLVAKIGK